MMYFEDNRYLYLTALMPVLVLLWLLNRRRQLKRMAMLGNKTLVKQLLITSPLYLQLLKYGLYLLAFLLLIMALAKPYIMGVDERAKHLAPADIVFVIDVSKSMYVKDVAPDRISRAKKLMREILGQLNNEEVGIVLFAGKATTYLPLTSDYYYVNKSVDAITADLVAQQGTSLREALKISSLIFTAESKKTKVMCLLSDGEFHDNNAFPMADSIRKSGIAMFAFGFGTTGGGEVPAAAVANNELVEKDAQGNPVISNMHQQELLKITGNNAVNYANMINKPDAAAAFAGRLRELEYSQVYSSPKPYYSMFLIAALLLLIAEACIPQVVKTHKLD